MPVSFQASQGLRHVLHRKSTEGTTTYKKTPSHFSTPQSQEPHNQRNVSMGLPTALIGSPQALPVWSASPCPPAMPLFLRSDLDPRVVTHHTSHLSTSISSSTHLICTVYIPYTPMPRPLHPRHLQRVRILPPLTIKVFIISKKKPTRGTQA